MRWYFCTAPSFPKGHFKMWGLISEIRSGTESLCYAAWFSSCGSNGQWRSAASLKTASTQFNQEGPVNKAFWWSTLRSDAPQPRFIDLSCHSMKCLLHFGWWGCIVIVTISVGLVLFSHFDSNINPWYFHIWLQVISWYEVTIKYEETRNSSSKKWNLSTTWITWIWNHVRWILLPACLGGTVLFTLSLKWSSDYYKGNLPVVILR